MESMAEAVSFARALLALERARRSGVLHVTTEFGVCRIAMADGVARAASGFPPQRALGDALCAGGALDASAHASAVLNHEAPRVPIGDWLVERGLATRPAVEVALRCQLRERIVFLSGCRQLDYRFAPGEADAGMPFIEEPIAAPDLVLCAMRARMASVSDEQARRLIPAHELGLHASGRELGRRAALWPQESVAMALLARGATLDAILRATFGSPRALRLVALLGLLSLLTERQSGASDYALLLRKRAQLRERCDPYALLDLPEGALPTQARRALRRLASRVHPDRLGDGASAALRRTSSEVMSALIDAERMLRASDVRPLS
jgi:hypothetical protein